MALFKARMVRSASAVQLFCGCAAGLDGMPALPGEPAAGPLCEALGKEARGADRGVFRNPICSGKAAEIQIRFLRPGNVARLLAMYSIACKVIRMR